MKKNYLLLEELYNRHGFVSLPDVSDERWLVPASFDPWTGMYLNEGYEDDYRAVLGSEFSWKEKGNKKRIKERIFQRYKEWGQPHAKMQACDRLYDLVLGDEKDTTRLQYIPNIRTYAILNKKEYGGFEPMDYCPFCGAKLPERLDDKLTEILQKEYGLNSWRDYKKAPAEFHTDEWWKKRGL